MTHLRSKRAPVVFGVAVAALVGSALAMEASAASKPKLVIESPAKGQSMKPVEGLDSAVTVKWRVENFRLGSLDQGEAAPSAKEPAMARNSKDEKAGAGFVHVSVDDGPWFFVRSSAEPIVVAGFAPGSHKITLELVGLTHESLSPPERASVRFTVGSEEN